MRDHAARFWMRSPNSDHGYDKSSPPARSQRQLSPFRSFHFHALTIVLLSDADYSVWQAVEIPVDVVELQARRNDHVNGWILHATQGILNHERASDLTSQMKALSKG